MRILISGSSGLIGSALRVALAEQGHEIIRLVRSKEAGGAYWNPDSLEIDASSLESIQAVIHLAGKNVASERWTESVKREIRDSRVRGTRLLAGTLAQMQTPPKVLITASAIGYYGDRGDEILTEDSPAGTGFLAEVCEEWERAVEPAREKGIRVVCLRLGTVLDPNEGALAKMLRPFRFGLGGIMGTGEQYWSWITLKDVVSAVIHCLQNEEINGPVNCTSPNPVTNREFTETLADTLSRPAFMPAPAFALILVLGEMAESLILSSVRVEPRKLLESGFHFRYPDLKGALMEMVGE